MVFTVPTSGATMAPHHVATHCSSLYHQHNVNHHHQLQTQPPSCVMGIPMGLAGQQGRRRNSFSHSRSNHQPAVARAFISDDGFGEHHLGEEHDREDRDALLHTTHEQLSQIEQQMMIMMGQRMENEDDALSVGSSDDHILGKQDVEFHQDLSAAAAGKHYSSSFVSSQSPAIDDQTHCFVILFGMGSEETEGIYTLRTVEYEDGDVVNVDTVVAFANEVDAQRFATLLEASLKHHPAVYSTSWGDITEWCEENNAKCRLEPSGSLLIPPESNVSVTDWERALALQRGEYSVLEEEPARAGPIMNLDSSSVDKEHDIVFKMDVEEEQLFESMFDFHHVGNSSDQDNVSNIVDSRLANASLNSVREELERLLGNSC